MMDSGNARQALPLFAATRAKHPASSFIAAGKVNIANDAAYALQVFSQYPNRTRRELAALIGYPAAERACKRASDLERAGYLIRAASAGTREMRNALTERGREHLKEIL